MSQSNSILNLLGITDKNISVSDVTDGFIGHGSSHRRIKIIHASLSYSPKNCPNCNSDQVIKNGRHSVNARIASLNGQEYHMYLKKQRFLCHHCGHTFGATSQLLRHNQTMTQPIIEAIIAFSKDGPPVKEIVKILGISTSTAHRLLYKNRSRSLRAKVLPKHLSIDEFRSTGHDMSFIAVDSESHDILTLLSG